MWFCATYFVVEGLQFSLACCQEHHIL